MCYSNRGAFREQVNVLRRQFLQDGGLPFTDVLTEQVITDALAAVGGWLDRVSPPLVTLWVFLGQVLSADHSCRAAVARLNAHRAARGLKPCSARTGAYCRARKRLPEAFLSGVACSVGRSLDAKAEPGWRWKGRRVYLFDGTTVTRNLSPAGFPSAARWSVCLVLLGAQAPLPGPLPGLTGWPASADQGRVRGSRLGLIPSQCYKREPRDRGEYPRVGVTSDGAETLPGSELQTGKTPRSLRRH